MSCRQPIMSPYISPRDRPTPDHEHRRASARSLWRTAPRRSVASERLRHSRRRAKFDRLDRRDGPRAIPLLWLAGQAANRFLWLALRPRHRGLRSGRADPRLVLPVREKAARFAGLAPDDLAQALVLRYDPGARRPGDDALPATQRRWVRAHVDAACSTLDLSPDGRYAA